MKLYFIRHAPTENNVSGIMAQNYDDVPIIQFNKTDWWNCVGMYLGHISPLCIYTSPVLRCHQTAECLFGVEGHPMSSISEFDCKGLGSKKFWKISKPEFERLVPLTSADMAKQVELMLTMMSLRGKSKYAMVSHGMYIRYLYHYLTGNRTISPYDVINSNGFSFGNLDMLEVDMGNGAIMVHRYKEPIKRI